MIDRISDYWSGDEGATAVEFALILPVMILVIFGIFEIALLMFTFSSLNRAVDEAARCASARPNACTGAYASNASTVLGWARNTYAGTANATFTYSNSAECSQEPSVATNNGRSVTGTASFKISLPFVNRTIPLSATSCYPYYNG